MWDYHATPSIIVFNVLITLIMIVIIIVTIITTFITMPLSSFQMTFWSTYGAVLTGFYFYVSFCPTSKTYEGQSAIDMHLSGVNLLTTLD